MKSVLLKTIIFRISSILAVQTYFVADEYWQSLEIAHLSIFNYGYRTWEFNEEIRSAAYPCIFVIIYKFLAFFHLDYAWCIIYIPRLFQAVLSAFADTFYFYWCRSFHLPTREIWTVIALDWFSFFCHSRTLINTFETNLVIFGLYSFPWNNLKNEQLPYLSVFLVTAICFIRPTAVLVWGPLCLLWLIHSHKRQTFLTRFIVCGALTVFALFLLDSAFYANFTLTPWNFLRVNVFKGVASFYGSHPIHWYLTQGLPVVLGAFTLPFSLQVFLTLKSLPAYVRRKGTVPLLLKVNFIMVCTIFISIAAYSLVPHKEFRFILPLQPMMMFLAIQGLQPLRSKKVFQYVMLAGFFVPVLLFGQLHQRGSLSVMKTLSNDAAESPKSTSILILMPCHSTPFYSHLHVRVPARFITCDPPLAENAQDESEVFFTNSKKWLDHYLTENAPSHVVMFDRLAPELNVSLMAQNFTMHEKHFHTIFPEGRIGSYIFIYRKNSWPSL